MSIKQAFTGATNVVKSSASLDFFSNATKSTTTDTFLNAVDISKFKKPVKKSKSHLIRSSVKPFHPFLNASESYKLNIVTRSHKPSQPLTHEAQFSDGQSKISNDFTFSSNRDALVFVNNMRPDFIELEQIACQRPELQVDNIDDMASQIIHSKLDMSLTLDSLTDILSLPLTNSRDIQVTKEEKVTYIIQRYLTPETSSIIFKFLQHYITMVDNPHLALRTFHSVRQGMTRHGMNSKKSFLIPFEELYNTLITTYPTLLESPELQVSILSAYLFYKQTAKSHEILRTLEQEGYSPDSELFARYLKLASKNSSNSQTNTNLLKQLRGLDDTIFTTMDSACAQILISGSRTFNELASIIDILEMRYDSENLKSVVPQIESTICETLSSFSTSSPSLQGLNGDSIFPQQLGLLKRLSQYSPWSPETQLFILQESIKQRSFILARQLLTDISLNKDSWDHLNELTQEDGLNKSLYQTKPGRDSRSFEEFLRTLEEKRV